MVFEGDFCQTLPIVSKGICQQVVAVSQTSFSYISTNSLTILTVSMSTKSPWKDLLINTSYISKRSIITEILGRSTGNYYSTVY